MATENFVISTPSGRRVLTDFGDGFAAVRPSYAPEETRATNEKLQFAPSAFDNVTARPDGTFINARHLYAIAVGMAKMGKTSIRTCDIADRLFYPHHRPDIQAIFRQITDSHWLGSGWWNEMARYGRYDAASAMILPI